MSMTIIAVPTRLDNTVDDHFGHCRQYSLFAVDDHNAVQEAGIVPSLPGCGCKSNIAIILKAKGVSMLLAGNMGAGAVNVLHLQGIEVHRGCSGDARKAVETFLAGEWKDSGRSCSAPHDEGGHQCHSQG
jgi:predicted Fe-Mo cluster-binding NifX family protein